LAIGGAYLVAGLNRPGADLGPTAATLTDVWNSAVGAGLGLLIGSALVAIFARRGSRTTTGILAAELGSVAVVLGFSVLERPSDEKLGDALGFVLLALCFESIPILLGATIGASVAEVVDGYRRRSAASH
jgi:hypothetical protein